MQSEQNVTVIGDVHGCLPSLSQLLEKIPEDSPLIFIGDLINRFPASFVTLRLFHSILYIASLILFTLVIHLLATSAFSCTPILIVSIFFFFSSPFSSFFFFFLLLFFFFSFCYFFIRYYNFSSYNNWCFFFFLFMFSFYYICFFFFSIFCFTFVIFITFLNFCCDIFFYLT